MLQHNGNVYGQGSCLAIIISLSSVRTMAQKGFLLDLTRLFLEKTDK